MIENKFFGPETFPGGPVVRQDDSSRILVRHGTLSCPHGVQVSTPFRRAL